MPRTQNFSTSDNQFFQKSERIQQQAETFLAESNLLSISNRYGQVKVVGAFALKTMLRRDIDILIKTDVQTPEKIGRLTNELLATKSLHSIVYKNMYNQIDRHFIPIAGEPHPQGHYWLLFTSIESRSLRIDIWMVESDNTVFDRDLARFTRKLTGPSGRMLRLRILGLKNHYLQGDTYKQSLTGAVIYSAVLDHGIETVEQFEEYLRSLPFTPS